MVWLEIIVVLGAIFLVFAVGNRYWFMWRAWACHSDSGIWSAYGVAASRRDPDYYDRCCGGLSLTGRRRNGLSGTRRW